MLSVNDKTVKVNRTQLSDECYYLAKSRRITRHINYIPPSMPITCPVI